MATGRARLQIPARVLVVDEEPSARLVSLALDHGHYLVRIATSVAEARGLIRAWDPHLIIVDVELDRRAGMELITQRRAGGQPIPAIAITPRGDLKTKLAAFALGADDFLAMPFSPEELVARALAVMRRAYGEEIPFIPTITVGDIRIDLLNQRVKVGGSAPKVTPIELSLLYLLASNPGRVMGREVILDTLWGADYVAESNIVDRHIRNLRVKLKDNFRRPKYIATVAGKGYRFIVQRSSSA